MSDRVWGEKVRLKTKQKHMQESKQSHHKEKRFVHLCQTSMTTKNLSQVCYFYTKDQMLTLAWLIAKLQPVKVVLDSTHMHISLTTH